MVKRTINLRLLVITAVLGAAVVGGIYGLHRWQITRTARGLVALAEAQEQKSEWLKAASYLDRYLRLRPDDAPTTGKLALTYARGAKFPPERRRAVSLHYRALALEQGESAAEIRGSLANLLLELGRLTEAESEARKLLESSPDDPRATRVLALALTGQWLDGSLARADLSQLAILSAVEKARQTNPHEPRVATVLAMLLRDSTEIVQAEYPQLTLLDRQKRADATMDALVKEGPKDGKLFLARYSYRLKYALPDAQRDLDRAIELAPDDSDVLAAAGTSALAAGQRLGAEAATAAGAKAEFARAKAMFEKLVAKPAEERLPGAYLHLGDAQLALGQADAARATWHKGLALYRQPTIQIALQARIAESLLASNRADEARPMLDELKLLVDKLGTSIPRDARIAFERERDLRLARWHVQRSDFAPSIPLLRSVALRQPQGDPNIETTLQALYLLGSVQVRLGDWVEAAAAFDEVARLSPGQSQARQSAASAYLMLGRPQVAAERAEQALAGTETADAWLLLAAAELQQQLTAAPAARNWQRLLEALDVLDKQRSQLTQGTPWQVDFLRVDYLMAGARAFDHQAPVPPTVTEILKSAESKYAGQKAFWLQICSAYQNLGLLADAERALAELQNAGGTAVEVALASSRLASRRSDYTAAATILEDAAKSATAAERKALRGELLRVAIAAQDIDQARGILAEEHRVQPRDLAVIRRLGELELTQRDFAAAERWAQEAAHAANGAAGQLLARYLLSWRTYSMSSASDDAALKQALTEIQEVLSARPAWAEAVALKGLIAVRLGQDAEAASELARAIGLGDRRLLVFEQLVSVLERLGRWSEAELYLSRLSAELPRTQRLAEAAANFELHRDKPEDAVKIARDGVAQRPQDPRAHLWLGRMLLLTGQLVEAERSLAKAVELGPTDPAAWNGLVALHVRTNEKSKAEAALAQLEQTAQIDPAQKALLLAQGYEALGHDEAARQQFVELEKLAGGDHNLLLRVAQHYLTSDPREAERILRDLVAKQADSHAARRMLALALAPQGEKGLEEAQAILTQAGVDEAVASVDQRIRALLLVQQGGLANLQRAVQIVEALVASQQSPLPGDRQLLAQLYEREALVMDDSAAIDAKLKAAQSHWEEAASARTAPPAALAAVVQFLVRQGRKGDAIGWLDKLERAVEEQPKRTSELVALVVQMQVLAGASDRSEKWVAALDKAGLAGGLRALILEARVAADRDPGADIESLVEPRAVQLAATAANPAEQVVLYAGLGELYTSLKRYPAAETWHRRLVEVAPAQYPVLVGSLSRQERLADAIGVCAQAAKTDATTRPALVVAAALSEGKPSEQDFKEARPIIAAALAKFPTDTGLLYAVTLVDLLQGQHDEAIKHYRQILAANPRHIAALNNLAMLLGERPADRAEALRLVEAAIQIVGKDPGLLDTKGAILVYSSRPAEAVPLLISATRGETADPRHHFHLAVAYRDQGMLDEAKAQLKIALQRNLDRQLLMPTDQRLLADVRTQLSL